MMKMNEIFLPPMYYENVFFVVRYNVKKDILTGTKENIIDTIKSIKDERATIDYLLYDFEEQEVNDLLNEYFEYEDGTIEFNVVYSGNGTIMYSDYCYYDFTPELKEIVAVPIKALGVNND